ncbi:tryptophan halogenase family protein [Sinorhizobium meliloti]|uniref:tryptophan halogenase family protein n=1 Tax=Rhizobium meliloti TaxID=382 RepID=UPI002090CC3A|nr:tryptophan halogenase family protein [Sinorhizobium meliloti]MCO5965124.1 tryptophan 7-halogenase [Sinorhizobium meliloti]
MLNLTSARRIGIVGGDLVGWLAAIELRRVFEPDVDVTVIETPELFSFGLGEGGSLNLVDTLCRNELDLDIFVGEAGATYKLGVLYDNWRGGGISDRYYRLFCGPGIAEIEWRVDGFFPLLSARIAMGEDLHTCVPGFEAIARHASQKDIERLLATGQSGLCRSYHFDAEAFERYLKRVGLSRGITAHASAVCGMRLDERGYVRSLHLDGEQLEVDFVIDASGFARLGLGSVFGTRWRSFANTLPTDRAITFDLEPSEMCPDPVTRLTAMKAGWMWEVPLNRKITAGYVFSSRHADHAIAVAEVEHRLGHRVQPKHLLSLDQGYFERAWVNNLVALGTASGFVEPLDAALATHTFEQLRNIGRVLTNGGGVVPAHTIEAYNSANARSWTGARDFLRLHYDCKRNDVAFWRDIAAAELPEGYAELRACFHKRTPRWIDIQPYVGSGWQALFHQLDWISVAASLGVVPATAARAELRRLSAESRREVQAYLDLLNGTMSRHLPPSGWVH